MALRRHRAGDPPVDKAPVPQQRMAVNGAPPVAEATGAPRLGELLINRGILTKARLTPALEEQLSTGTRLGRVLVNTGLISDEDLAQLLAEQMDLPLADLRTTEPDPETLALLSESVARSSLALPLQIEDGRLLVAVAEPDAELAATLSRAAGVPVSLLVAPRGDVEQALNRYYRALGDIHQFVEQFEKLEPARPGVAADTVADVAAPVVRIVNLIVTQALRDRASDVHIEPQDTVLRIRFRIDGALHDAISLPSDIAPALVSRIKILAGMNIVERRRPQDGQFAMTIDDRGIDVRVSTTSTIWGETCVMRILDKNRSLLDLDQLGMPAGTYETFSALTHSPFGMVLCAGPTGSGKTTTLYASIQEINKPTVNIMTIEDPVEYILPSINQIQMNETAGVTFATGLRSILRQDPDVILVGEIRDVETARIAVQSALTGHFVLSSLHATDAVAALHRFLDMGIESFLIASSVVAVVGQRLVRRICTYCKQPYRPTPEEMAFYSENGGRAKRAFYIGAGCNFCANTGYLERIGVYELLRVTPEIRRLVVGWASQDELRRMATSQGMRTLQHEAIRLIEQDVTTVSEVLRAIYAF